MYDDPTLYSYSSSYSVGDLTSLTGLWSMVAVMLIPALLVGLAVYVYMSLALMKIAQKTNTPNAWLAWIPIGNLYLMTQIAQVPWWTFLLVFLSFIPFVGSLLVLGLMIWWWMKIAERCGKPSWWGVMIGLIPIANFIFMGMLAWGKDEKPAK